MGAKSKTAGAGSGQERVDPFLLDRAVKALLKHHKSSGSSGSGDDDGKAQLFGTDAAVQVQFGLNKAPGVGVASAKPIRVEIPHPIAVDENGDDVDVCIIVKESSKAWVQEVIDRFPRELKCVKKVLGLDSLRKKHARYEQQRELLHRFDVFLADDRILPMIGKHIGKHFFATKKQPIPIKLTREEALPFAVRKCLAGTFMWLSAGTCVTIKAGTTAMSPDQLLANVQSIVNFAPSKVPRKWANVRSISVKTPSSVALPVYNKTHEELEELRSMTKADGKDTDAQKGEAQKTDVGEDEGVSKKRKEEVEKSPLARALKKQKVAEQMKKDPEDEKGGKKRKSKNVKGGKEVSVVEEKKKEKNDESVMKKEPKKREDEGQPKKKRAKEEEGQNQKTEEKEVGDAEVSTEEEKGKKKKRKKAKKSKKETSEGEGTGDKSSSAVDEAAVEEKVVEKKPKKAKKNKRDRTESSALSEDATAKTETEQKDFILSKKFRGSKKGCVFRKGKEGLGYYRDVLPKVDGEWLKALARKSGGKDASPGQQRGKSKSPGRRKKGRR